MSPMGLAAVVLLLAADLSAIALLGLVVVLAAKLFF
jgi:hypothetical protein